MKKLIMAFLIASCSSISVQHSGKCSFGDLSVTFPASHNAKHVSTDTASGDVWLRFDDARNKTSVLSLDNVQGTFEVGQLVRMSKFDFPSSKVKWFKCNSFEEQK
jgi:hypothetical protein